jgi:hypothetical protein
MDNLKESFKKNFKFLITEYKFSLEKEIIDDVNLNFQYINKNRSVGVKIVYEFRESYIFITLCSLLNGKLCENPKNINDNSKLICFSLDDIINLTDSQALIKPTYKYPDDSYIFTKKNGFSLYVKKFSENLRKYGKDILKGNFSVFPILDKIVKKRVKDYNDW